MNVYTRCLRLACPALIAAWGMVASAAAQSSDALERGFAQPPPEARLRAYWWWLNGNVTKAAITRDLEQMAAKGFGGALICDAGGADQDGNDRVPHGPTFFSPEWRELYRHALREADRLGLEMSLNIQSGWNLGGPMVKPEDAPKRLVWSEVEVTGPTTVALRLPEPKHPPQFYRDIAVVAYRIPTQASRPTGSAPAGAARLQHWEAKALHKVLGRSAPDTSALLTDLPAVEGEAEALSHDVLELTSQLDANGSLAWAVPDGRWQILRFGCTLNQSCHVSTCSEGWQGYAIDPFDAQTFRAYWQEVVEPLIADAGPLAGGALKYLHTDSWEVEVANWTPTLREEFRRRRGYDLLPFLPAMAGRMVDSREVTNRFLHDFRKTMGDLALDNHYRWFSEWAHAHGLSIHPESGGPHAVPVDSLRCLGNNDAPMSEFWARSWRHRVADQDRFFVKQPASAAHTYGRPFVLAEGFTTIGPHWQETLWDNLKPSFNRAACEGLNRLVWHAFTCSPDEMGRPGQEYFAGTHFNPNATWWNKSGPFLAYINRCQLLLQRGRFVADALYYYGDHVPNFAQLKASDPARILPGYDYDVATEEVLLTRLSVRDGRMVLPDGVSYRVLVLPNHRAISLPVLRKVRELVAAGGTVIGPKPGWATGLQGYPASDAEVAQIATELWGDGRADASVVRSVGAGRVIRGKTAREVLLRDGVQPDFEYAEVSFTPASQSDAQTAPCLDYIHRRIGTIGNLAADARQQGTAQATSPDAVSSETDIYFVCNTTGLTLSAKVTFRVAGKAPELWDPLTGQIRNLPVYQREADRTSVPLTFAPFGSWFVVFRNIAAEPGALKAKPNFPVFSTLGEVGGPWTVQFDPAWGGPASVEFSALLDWTQHADEAIRFYSGTAVYTRRFAPLPLPGGKRIYLNLGDVRQVAEVRLNGRNLGVLWSMPFRVEVTDALRPGENLLEIEVVNFWANRVIGDQALPIDRRRTRTNIRKLTSATPLAPSGLLGPVVLEWTEE